MDVKAQLMRLKELLPSLKSIDELLLDAKALKELSGVVVLQREWLARRASSLYIDPLLVEVKVKVASEEALAKALVKSWHPIAQLEQIPQARIMQAIEYWNSLATLEQRREELGDLRRGKLEEVDLELGGLRIMSSEEFEGEMEKLLRELKARVGEKEERRVEYWEFVTKEDFRTTVLRAYLVSFLANDKRIRIERDPLKGILYLSPWDEEMGEEGGTGAPKSLVIAFNHDLWRDMIGRCGAG